MNLFRIYNGFDQREADAYKVAESSFYRRSKPGSTLVWPVTLQYLRDEGILNRPVEIKDGKMWCPISQAPMATEFAISRFAVPFLAQHGWALFVDCDVVCLSDVAELFALADNRYAVMVVKHGHLGSEGTKMDGQIQTVYPRKNWSSVVLWNCSHPSNKRLTKEMLNSAPGRDLHAFRWLNDDEIGSLPSKWNYLIGVSAEPASNSGIYHYTLGGPWIKGWKGGPLDDLWFDEAEVSNVRL